jgi:enterobacterial common antigen flippase
MNPTITATPPVAAFKPATHGGRAEGYAQILRSTALIGGSSAINVAIGIARTKAMALFLGPAGLGLLGLFGSVADVVQNLAGMGIQTSGVRQIAEAVGTGEAIRISRTVTVLRRVAVLFGALGGALLVLFARPISQLTFGDTSQTAGVALMAIVVFLREVSAGQGALIQGMRRIGDLARISVLGALFGLLTGVPLVYWLRDDGVVPSLISAAAVSGLTSWWYSRRVVVAPVDLTLGDMRREASDLLRLGFAFMSSGLLTTGAAYAVRIIVVRVAGFEAAGLYQSAWALGGLYVGFILQAMGTDFYPRLTAVAKDHPRCNELVNQQALVSMLLAGPGVIATLTFAPLVIALFYSAKFAAAVGVLRWLSMGMMLRVIAWPMGFIVVAKGEQKIFVWTEIAATAVHVGLAWLLVRQFGLAGAGMAFFGLYVWHGTLIYVIVRRLSGFAWSAENRRTALLFLPAMALVFVGVDVLPFWLATTIGTIAVLAAGTHSVRMLAGLAPDGRVSRILEKIARHRR